MEFFCSIFTLLNNTSRKVEQATSIILIGRFEKMNQSFQAASNQNGDKILCCYINATNNIQIIRIANITNWYFERVIFPGQRLLFEAMPEGALEIHTGKISSAILTDKISCDRLCVHTNYIQPDAWEMINFKPQKSQLLQTQLCS